jgi:hypothetical protein
LLAQKLREKTKEGKKNFDKNQNLSLKFSQQPKETLKITKWDNHNRHIQRVENYLQEHSGLGALNWRRERIWSFQGKPRVQRKKVRRYNYRSSKTLFGSSKTTSHMYEN